MIKNLKLAQILGSTALVVGVILLVFAYTASEAPLDRLSSTLTGRYTDQTMLYLVTGVVAVVAGGMLLLSGKRT